MRKSRREIQCLYVRRNHLITRRLYALFTRRA